MLVVEVVRCAIRTTGLLCSGHLHVGNEQPEVVLVVRFRLRFVPPGSRIRRWLFERESILNTMLFAGRDGYLVKYWMVDPESSEYAGMYDWSGADSARRYAAYITAVLRPLAVPGSVSSHVYPRSTAGGVVAKAAA